jgi:hypothetical protein
VLRHVVLFAFRPDAPAGEIERVCEHFGRLPREIDLVQGFEWGTDVSPEGFQQGFTHCFLIDFASDTDRDAYLVHPAHRAFVEAAQPVLARALVVDYWSRTT